MVDDDITDDDIFASHRPRLTRIAYRMLGSMSEAEDVVQDAWLRWSRVDVVVADAGAYLRRTVTRLCLDVLKSARARRETYVGSWLPEPVVDAVDDDVRLDELTLTLMLALERLSPLERAAFLLHDIFGVPIAEVAATLDRDGPAVRQLAVRARRHIEAARPRFPVDRETGERLALAFFTASRAGDPEALRELLAHDVVMKSDGGGRVLAFLNPIVGVDRIVRLHRGLHEKAEARAPDITPLWLDGLPGFVSEERGILQTTSLQIEDGRIVVIYITRNPDKLTRILPLHH